MVFARRAICLFVVVGFFNSISNAQSSSTAPNWLSSVSYGIASSSGNKKSFDIHVSVNSPNGPQYPCGSNYISLDDLVLSDKYSIPVPTVPINSFYLKNTAEQIPNSYSYHLPIGDNLPLSADWTQLSFQLAAHCNASGNSNPTYLSPVIIVNRNLYFDQNQISLQGLAVWFYSTDGKDTVQLTTESTRPVFIKSAFIRDDEDSTHQNRLSSWNDDGTTSSEHDMIFVQFAEALKANHPYKLVIDAVEDGVSIHKEMPLQWTSAISGYAVDQITNPSVLTIHDLSPRYFEIDVQTNDNGTISATFDSLAIAGSNTVQEEASTRNTRNHKIRLDLIGVKDGQYTFRFNGLRTNQIPLLSEEGEQLHSQSYVLNVDTAVRVSTQIGLKLLQGKTLSISYCLNRPDPGTTIQIFKSDDNSTLLNRPATSSGTCTDKTATAYAATADLSLFVQNLSKANDAKKTGNNPQQPSNSATAPQPTDNKPATGATNQPTLQPITIHIHDSHNVDIGSIDLDAVQVQDNSSVAQAIGTLADKNASSTDKDKAQNDVQTSLKAMGMQNDQIKSLVSSIRNQGSKGGAGSAIKTVLLTILRGAATAYLGIPAPQASK